MSYKSNDDYLGVSNKSIHDRGKRVGEFEASVRVMEDVVKFFGLDYSLGTEIMELFKTNDANNKVVAVNMLIGACKSSIKDEILEEINKEIKKEK